MHPIFLHRSLARQLRAIAGACAGAVNVTLGSGPLLLSDGPGLYANDMECVWLVQAAGPITVVFKTLRTGRPNDYVQISDGTGDDAVHRVFYGLELPPAFSTNSTRMTVKFHSDAAADGSSRFSGFELELYSLVPGGTRTPTSLATGVPSRPAGLTIGSRGRVPPRLPSACSLNTCPAD